MHLSVSQEKLNEEIGDEYRREQLQKRFLCTFIAARRRKELPRIPVIMFIE